MRTLYIKDVDGASGDVYYYKFAGTSSETKPTRNVATGSEFLEVDTDKKYIYDEDSQTWVEEENQFSELLTEINSMPTEETGQELLAAEFHNTGLTDAAIMVLGMILNAMPQDDIATDIMHSISLECERLDAIYENWMSERSA